MGEAVTMPTDEMVLSAGMAVGIIGTINCEEKVDGETVLVTVTILMFWRRLMLRGDAMAREARVRMWRIEWCIVDPIYGIAMSDT